MQTSVSWACRCAGFVCALHPCFSLQPTAGAKGALGSHRCSKWGPQHVSCHASAGMQLPVLSNETETPLDPEGGQDSGGVTWGSVTLELECCSVTSLFQDISPITKCHASLFFQSKLFVCHKSLAIIWLLFNLSDCNFMQSLSLVISSLGVSDLGQYCLRIVYLIYTHY